MFVCCAVVVGIIIALAQHWYLCSQHYIRYTFCLSWCFVSFFPSFTSNFVFCLFSSSRSLLLYLVFNSVVALYLLPEYLSYFFAPKKINSQLHLKHPIGLNCRAKKSPPTDGINWPPIPTANFDVRSQMNKKNNHFLLSCIDDDTISFWIIISLPLTPMWRTFFSFKSKKLWMNGNCIFLHIQIE